jgi:ABC-type dipeptide/oligopeptide/nickel transport system permease component
VLNYIIRRLLLMFPTLIGITLLVFGVMAIAPGGLGAGLRTAEGNMRPEQRRQIEEYYNKRYGLDLPWYRQYLRWLNQVSPIGSKPIDEGWPKTWSVGFKAPNLGESFLRRRQVIDVIAETLPVTLLLNLVTTPIVYAIAITAGIYTARQRGKTADVATGTVLLALWSIPTMWAGVMLIGFFANKDYFNWFPSAGLHDTLADSMAFLPRFTASGFERGWLLDTVWHLVLPVVCLTYGGFAFLSKLMRASVLENLSADFARTARAKGLSERVVLLRHVLANSLLPLITVAASILPGLLGGSLIVESIFSLNGMGRLMIDAIYMKDRELVMSETLVIGVISLISLIIADICYAMADPRVTYE